MLETYRSAAQMGLIATSSPQQDVQKVHLKVIEAYRRAQMHGHLRSILAALTGRSNQLRHLPDRQSGLDSVPEQKIRAVPLTRIVGSEDRSRDFDRNFAPLQEHTRQRWLSVATAWMLGHMLPAVELIQIGEEYYVRDGHHRISVASAFGQVEIDAHVLVWRAVMPECVGAALVPAPA